MATNGIRDLIDNFMGSSNSDKAVCDALIGRGLTRLNQKRTRIALGKLACRDR
jgi:hypothetical protein